MLTQQHMGDLWKMSCLGACLGLAVVLAVTLTLV